MTLDLERMIPGGYRRFLLSWLDDPLAVGAVAPSGRPLARMLTQELASGHRVVELGPGTGTVTREILARGIAEEDLTLIERCPGFARSLEHDFPRARVVQGDAAGWQPALIPYRGTIDYVISGLPLVLFSREQKHRLLLQAFRLLKPSGAFFQFTYGGRCPLDRRQLRRHGLAARCVGFIALNMPPAFVYRVARTGADG